MDSYRVFLWVVFFFEVAFALFLGGKLSETYSLYSILRPIGEASGPLVAGTPVCVSGKVERKSQVGKNIDRRFDQVVETEIGLRDYLLVHGVWKHTTGSGKSSRTHIDLRRSLTFDFDVMTPEGPVGFRGYPQHIFSLRSASYRCRNMEIGKMSPASTRVELQYFNPSQLWLIGVPDPPKPGERRVLTNGIRAPLILSELSLSELKTQLFVTVILMALTLCYLAISFFVNLKMPLKETFDRNRHAFLILDRTGGSEIGGIVLLVLYAIGGIVVAVNLTFVHSFQNDRKVALLLLGFYALVHVCKGVEFFYLANRKTNMLIEVSRGFLSFSQRELCSLDQLKPRVETHTGSKGEKSYSLNADINGQDTQLVDSMSSEEKAQKLLSEFREFQQAPMAEEDPESDGDW
jgi:hypothetical protein